MTADVQREVDGSMVWTERKPLGPGAGGDVGGDYQTGQAFSRSWKSHLHNGHWVVLTDTWYPVSGPVTAGIERQIEYAVCTDPDRPGDTEISSEGRYQNVVGEASEAMARDYCAKVEITDELFAWDGWPR